MKFKETKFRNLTRDEVEGLPGMVADRTKICSIQEFDNPEGSYPISVDLLPGQMEDFKNQEDSYNFCILVTGADYLNGYESKFFKSFDEVLKLGQRVLNSLIKNLSDKDIKTFEEFNDEIQPIVREFSLEKF